MAAFARRVWRRLAGPFQEFGWADGALYSAARLLRGLSDHTNLHIYDLMVQPVSSTPLLAPNRLRNVRFAPIPEGHPDIARMPARTDIKALRFAQGAECLGAYRHDALIGFVWFCTPAYEEDEVRCTYRLTEPQTSVFDFDMYVFPEYRMGTAFMAVWHGANGWLSARGITHTFSRVTRFNLASRRSHAHLGAVRAGVASFLQLWRLEVMLASVSPWFAVHWNPARRVELRLAPVAPASDAKAGNVTAAPPLKASSDGHQPRVSR